MTDSCLRHSVYTEVQEVSIIVIVSDQIIIVVAYKHCIRIDIVAFFALAKHLFFLLVIIEVVEGHFLLLGDRKLEFIYTLVNVFIRMLCRIINFGFAFHDFATPTTAKSSNLAN